MSMSLAGSSLREGNLLRRQRAGIGPTMMAGRLQWPMRSSRSRAGCSSAAEQLSNLYLDDADNAADESSMELSRTLPPDPCNATRLRSNPFNREPVGEERLRQALAASRNLRFAPLFA